MEGEWLPLSFDGGLNTFDRPSQLSQGQAQQLDNFEWLDGGGVTPRPAWLAAGASPTGGPGAGSRYGRGGEESWYESGVRKLILAYSNNGTAYSIYKTNVGDPTAFNAYSLVENITVTGLTDERVSFAVGMGVLLSTHPGYPSVQLRSYDGATAGAVPTAAVAGRTLIYHLSRFFVGGSVAEPTYLRYSQIGDYEAWVLEENYIPVGQDDGEPIESIVIWDRGLVIGKQHSLWFLSGATVDQFTLQPLNAKIGPGRGRAMVPTEHGVFFVGVDGNVYLYDGGDVVRVSRRHAVDTTILGAGFYTMAWIGEQLYISHSSQGSTLWVYEPKNDRWRQEKVNSTSTNAAVISGYDHQYLFAQPLNGSRALSVRGVLGQFSTSGKRSPQPDEGDDGLYVAVSREEWPAGPMGKATLRSIYIRYRQWTGGTSEKITITPVVNGTELTAQAKTVGGKAAAGVYAQRVDFNAEGGGIAVKLSVNPTGSENETYAIEEAYQHIIVDSGRR